MIFLKGSVFIKHSVETPNSCDGFQLNKMTFLVIFMLFFVKFCDSNDFQCVHINGTIKSVEFYCENFNEILPANCSTTYLYSIGYYDKTKVTQLKIGGCDQDKITQIVEDFQNIRSLDISNSNLKSLKPFKIKLEHLRELNISHNDLGTNLSEIWAKMPRLMKIDLSFNQGLWSRMLARSLPVSLTEINLSHNNVTLIDKYDLSYLPNAEKIDLSNNMLEKIGHQNIFASAKNLLELQLENNRYKKFDKKFELLMKRDVAIYFTWTYVTDFMIEENLGKPIHVVIDRDKEGVWPSSDRNRIEFHCNKGSFDNIHTFTFNNNQIENINDLLQCLTSSLKQLSLVGNFTGKLISTSLEPFTNLYVLFINGVQKMEFDFRSIKNPKLLHMLDISSNNLKEIGNVALLKWFKSIFHLNVAENQIENAYEIFRHFRGSRAKIYLNGNHVGKLNATTFEHVNLSDLFMKDTNLSFDNVRTFESIGTLKQLDISYNNLENVNFSMPSTALKNLTHFLAAHCNIANASELIELLGSPLQILDLSGNRIGQLNATTFEGFVNLQILNLSETYLTDFYFDIFPRSHNFGEIDLTFIDNFVDANSTAMNLSQIYLDGNELTEIDAIKYFPNMQTVSISYNKIPCTSLAQLLRDRPDFKFITNPFKQQNVDCSNVVGLINQLGFVGTFIGKWL